MIPLKRQIAAVERSITRYSPRLDYSGTRSDAAVEIADLAAAVRTLRAVGPLVEVARAMTKWHDPIALCAPELGAALSAIYALRDAIAAFPAEGAAP